MSVLGAVPMCGLKAHISHYIKSVTHHTMMKLGTVTPYLKKIKRYI